MSLHNAHFAQLYTQRYPSSVIYKTPTLRSFSVAPAPNVLNLGIENPFFLEPKKKKKLSTAFLFSRLNICYIHTKPTKNTYDTLSGEYSTGLKKRFDFVLSLHTRRKATVALKMKRADQTCFAVFVFFTFRFNELPIASHKLSA